MALDGIMISALCRDFSQHLAGAKTERITQPEKDDIVLHFHVQSGDVKNVRLLLSANPSKACAFLTSAQYENPLVPPNFCMLLRKHIGGARLLSVSQPGLERVLVFTFECRTELYETVKKKLILEIMGRWSNLVLTDENDKIIDALRPVDFSVSEKRQLFAGLKYELPPSQNKALLSENVEVHYTKSLKLDRFLTETFTGFSPLISRELSYKLTGSTEGEEVEDALLNQSLSSLYKRIQSHSFVNVVLFSEKPVEFYCFDIDQYGSSVEKKFFDTPSQAVEAFFAQRQQREHLKRGSADISKLLSTLISRTSRKIDAQLAELEDCKKAEKYKRKGDIITSNIYKLKKGDEKAVLTDFYSDPVAEIEVVLDKRLSPQQNAQKYYKLYKKSISAKENLSRQIPLAKSELAYLESVLQSVDEASTLSDIAQIRAELASGGYIKTHAKNRKDKKIKQDYSLSEYRSSDGFTILVGKNNVQNDFLTLKTAEKRDIWFHVKNYPGSHVVVISAGAPVPDTTLTEAAIIAATNSKIKDGKNVEVDYTEVKNVKKPSGAKPGMVVYEVYKTAVVTPSADKINELIVKK